MNHFDVLIMLRRYRLWYAAVFVVTFFIGGYFLIPHVLKYEAESTFYLANESMVNPEFFTKEGQVDLLQVNLVQERVYQLAYSTEMMTFLIHRYNLYDHYNIDTTKSYYYEKAARKLSRNILFSKKTSDLSSITVMDRNNEMAATLSNAVVWKLDQLNKQYLINKIQANLNFYESFLKESARISKEQNEKLLLYMETLHQQRMKPAPGGQQVRPLSEVEFSLYEAAKSIEEVTTQLILARSLYSNALTAQQSKNLPSLVIIKRAFPELQSKKIYLVLFALLGSTLVCAVVILSMYFFFNYRDDINIVFGKDFPDSEPGKP